MTDELIDKANELLRATSDGPLSLREWLEYARENPKTAVTSSQYLLNAIEYAGTREVEEYGERLERWRFFDDPYNDGEHAVVGNTRMLRQFVESLRRVASPETETQQILWVEGPAATGKSELKRCIINGLREYSKTDEGKRFQCEWNVTDEQSSEVAWSVETGSQEDNWYEAPTQTLPHAVLPEDLRSEFVTELENEGRQSINSLGLDPFSRESRSILIDRYSGSDTLFEDVTDTKNFRVVPYTVEVGNGIGVLQSEDSGPEKKRLVGAWMESLLRELNSRGRMNPHAFSYDGLLAQGNNGVSIIEDAGQHVDLLTKLLNIPEEKKTKIDNELSMPVDTVFILISNLNFKSAASSSRMSSIQINRSLQRRLAQHKIDYLADHVLEALLLRREVTGRNISTTSGIEREILSDPETVAGTEIAPHTFEVAAMYEVMTRLRDVSSWMTGPTNLENLSLVDRAELLADGEIKFEGETIELSEHHVEKLLEERVINGIPVTYTRDMIMSLIHNNDMLLPQDVIEKMRSNFSDVALFDENKAENMRSLSDSVFSYAREQQESDVIDAILRDKTVDKKMMREYVEHVYEWGTKDSVEEVEEPDPLKMRVFETRFLNRNEEEYEEETASEKIEEFRQNRIIAPINNYIWSNRSEGVAQESEDVPLKEIPPLAELLSTNSWNDVLRKYENLNPRQWENPPENTETSMVKEQCTNNMIDMFGYSEGSAKKSSQYVMNQVNESWE